MGFDAGKFFGNLISDIQRDVTEVIGLAYDVPKDPNQIMERLTKNIQEHYLSYTVVGLILALIVSFFEPTNMWALFFFFAVLMAYLLIKDIDSSLLQKAHIEGCYVHIIAAAFYIIISMITETTGFAVVCLLISTIAVGALAVFQVKKAAVATA